MKSLSIVLPAFNEALNIRRSVEHATAMGTRLGLDFEVIVVDDGSDDATRQIVRSLEKRDPRVRSLHHERNRGYGAALRTGILASRKEYIFFTDADLQFDIDEIDSLVQYAGRYDIIAGFRQERADAATRRFNAWAWARFIGLLFDLHVRDIDCAFKLFHRRVFEVVKIESIGAFVNTELLVRARAAGFDIHEVPVSHFPRRMGEQSGANPKVVAKAFWETALLYNELRELEEGQPKSRLKRNLFAQQITARVRSRGGA